MEERISIVIPVYKSKELFLKLFENNYQFIKKHEIIIVDDFSLENIREALEEKYKGIKIFENAKNLGFSKTVNFGVNQATNDFVMLLNSDVKLLDDSYKLAVSEMVKDENIFAESFLQIEKDGKTIVGKNEIYFNKGFFHHKKASNFDYGATGWAEGGSSIFRKKYFESLGGFDIRYSPFYWEDVDLSYRASKKGYKIIFNSNVRVIHNHESTIGKYFKNNFVKSIAYKNQFIFTWLHANLFQKLLNIFYTFYFFIIFFIKKDFAYHKGFFKALISLFKNNE